MSQNILSFTGGKLYLDTTTFYALFRSLSPHAQTLFAAIEDGRYQAYTSVLTFDELAYRLILALIRDQHPGSALDNFRTQQAEMIATYYPQIAPHIDELALFPNLTILDLTPADVFAMNQHILRHALRPRDALHLASMTKCGCTAIVSEDSDFDHIPHIQRYSLLEP